jgi:hypothetical protein
MYIPEFWCGVISALGVELLLLIIVCLYIGLKK